MGNKVEEQIKKVMSAVFEIPEKEINKNSSSDTIELWDSLKHLNLIVALEDEFEIVFEDGEIMEMLNYALIEIIVIKKYEHLK